MKRLNSGSRALFGILCALALALAGGCAASPNNQPGEDTLAPLDTAPLDTAPKDTFPDTDKPDTVVIPEIELQVFAPSTCGCPLGTPQPTSTCGWYANEFAEIRVKAAHTAEGYKGAQGISKVKLFRMVETQAKFLDETSKVGTDGFFTLDFEAARSFLDEDDDGNYVDGFYDFRVEALSKISDANGQIMSKGASFRLYIDFTGPSLQILQPTGSVDARAKLSAKATLLFTSEDPGSGNGSFSVLLGSQATNTVVPVPDPSSSGPYFGALDLTPYETTDTDLIVAATDCLGNQSTASVPVRIIAVPRFVQPASTLLKKTKVGVGMRTLHAANGDNDGALGSLDLIGASADGVYVWWWNAANKAFDRGEAVTTTKDITEALFYDFSGDGNPDIVALAGSGLKKKFAVELWRQNINDSLDGTRKFTLVESKEVSDSASSMVLGDFNGDLIKDVAVASQNELETLTLVMHTGAKDGDEGTLKFLKTPTTFTGAAQTVSMVAADFNEDGSLDLALGRKGFQMVTVFTNNGKGDFPMGLDSMMIGLGSELVRVADLDTADSFPDLLVYNASFKSVFGFRGRGDGYFQTPAPTLGMSDKAFGQIHGVAVNPESGILQWDPTDGDLPIGDIPVLDANPFDMEVADFDGENGPDFAASLQGSKTIALFWGAENALGSGLFKQTFFLNGGASPGPLAAGDFNKDFAPDLAVANTDTGEILLFLNDGKGGFKGTRELPMPIMSDWTEGRLEPTHLVVANVDNAEGEDILVVAAQDKLVFSLPDNQGEEKPQEKNVPTVMTWLGVANRPPTYQVIRSTASPRFDKSVAAVAMGNLDFDGYPELVLISKNIPTINDPVGNFDVLRGGFNPTKGLPSVGEVQFPRIGRFWPLGTFKGPKAPTGVAIAPLDTEPPADLVMIAPQIGNVEKPEEFQPNIVRAYLTEYDNKWNPCSSNYPQIYFRCCGPDDPAEPCDKAFPSCALGNMCQGLTSPGASVGLEPIRVVAEDIDGDETTDLIVVNRGSNNVTYLRGEANPNYYNMDSQAKPWGLFAVGSDPRDLDVGDIDGDGWKDLVVALANKISVSYGSEGVNFETPVYLTKDEQSNDMTPTGVLMADVNDDGYIDIVASSGNRGRIWIYVSGGARDFLGPYSFECGSDPIDVVLAHLRESDCTDLAVLNRGSGTITLLENARCRN